MNDSAYIYLSLSIILDIYQFILIFLDGLLSGLNYCISVISIIVIKTVKSQPG